MRRPFFLGAVTALLLGAWAPAPAAALEQPTLLNDDDLRLGVPLSAGETEEATTFCRETLGRSGVSAGDLASTCACFPHQWEARTSRLHRLVLPLAMAPDAPTSRRNLAIIERQQGGIHEDRLQQLSSEYQIAARLAFKACR